MHIEELTRKASTDFLSGSCLGRLANGKDIPKSETGNGVNSFNRVRKFLHIDFNAMNIQLDSE